MYGSPDGTDFLHLPGDLEAQVKRLGGARAGDQEQRLVEPASKSQSFMPSPVGRGGAHEGSEQRVALARRRGELGVKLATEEPRMGIRALFRQLDDLAQLGDRRPPGDHQAAFSSSSPSSLLLTS
jgi:hypothetical protein